MAHSREHIDEYTLAAFIAGTLPSHRFEEVMGLLAQNAEARILLQMSMEAMQAATTSSSTSLHTMKAA